MDNRAVNLGVAALAALCCLTACVGETASGRSVNSPADSSVERAETPSYRDNESWTYRATDKLNGTWSSLLNGDYEITFKENKRIFLFVDGTTKRQANSTGYLKYMVPIASTIQDPEQYFKFPLFVGQSWQGVHSVGYRRYTAQNTVTGLETVQTPAGKFRAFKIERRVHFVLGDVHREAWSRTYDYYYSPDIKGIVKFAYKSESILDFGDATMERELNIELIDCRAEACRAKR